MPPFPLRQKADYIGITGSVLCLIHCLITPVLLTTSLLFNHHTLQVGVMRLDYLFIAVNLLAVWSASRYATRIVRTALWCCVSLLVAGLLLEDVHETIEYLVYAASLGLIITHLANVRQCHTQAVH